METTAEPTMESIMEATDAETDDDTLMYAESGKTAQKGKEVSKTIKLDWGQNGSEMESAQCPTVAQRGRGRTPGSKTRKRKTTETGDIGEGIAKWGSKFRP